MDFNTSPIRGYPANPNNPVTPVSGPRGPTSSGGQKRSLDSAHAKPWQTSVPLMAKGAPTALDLSALRDLTLHLAQADEGFATPMAIFALKVEESSNQKLLQNFSAFRQDLFTLLTPEILRTNPEYLQAYRKFLGRYRDSSLCSPVILKNSQGDEAKIDKLLICAASPVIERAFDAGWAECKYGVYLSDELNADFFEYVVDFIKTGSFLKEPDSGKFLDSLVARFTVAHSLEMQEVLRHCQSALSTSDLSLDRFSFEALWALGMKYADGFLKGFCLSKASHTLFSATEEFQNLQTEYRNLHSQIIFHTQGAEITAYSDAVMEFCREIHLREVRITGPLNGNLKAIESLKWFSKITLEAVQNPDIAILLANNPQLEILHCELDVRGDAIAEPIENNLALKTLSFRKIAIFSDEELNSLGAALQKNHALTRLRGLSPENSQKLKELLIEGPYERSIKLQIL